MVKIYCDGATDQCCYIIEGQDPTVVAFPKTTSNVGEYIAVIMALKEAKRLKLKQVVLMTDSQLIVNQVNGLWRCKKEYLLPLRDQARELLTECKATLWWIPRKENLAGRVLDGH